MDWLRRAWSWLSTGKRWLILPAIVAGIAEIVALARGRRAGTPSPGSAPGTGALTGDDADEAREAIETEANSRKAAAEARAGNTRARIEEARRRMRGGS